MIAEERLRQISAENYTHAWDDALAAGELSAAADCYVYLTHALAAPADMVGLLWPWHPSAYRPSADARRNLVKAGALYLAEGERYSRARKPDLAERCRHTAHQLAHAIDELG